MNPSGRPGRSYEQGNSNGSPVRKEVSWVTRVSQPGNRENWNQKESLFKIAFIELSGERLVQHERFHAMHWTRTLGDKVVFLDELSADEPVYATGTPGPF